MDPFDKFPWSFNCYLGMEYLSPTIPRINPSGRIVERGVLREPIPPRLTPAELKARLLRKAPLEGDIWIELKDLTEWARQQGLTSCFGVMTGSETESSDSLPDALPASLAASNISHLNKSTSSVDEPEASYDEFETDSDGPKTSLPHNSHSIESISSDSLPEELLKDSESTESESSSRWARPLSSDSVSEPVIPNEKALKAMTSNQITLIHQNPRIEVTAIWMFIAVLYLIGQAFFSSIFNNASKKYHL